MVDINKTFQKLLKKFLPKFLKAIKIDYGVGSAFTIVDSKKQGKKTSMKPLNMTKKDQEANIKTIEELVKGVNNDMAKQINYLVNQSVTEKWSTKMLADELKGIFNKTSPNYFNYKNRFNTIATTESFRILNLGQFNTAKRLGFTHKYLFNPMDSKTGEDSKIAENKYGSEDKAIPIDKPFKYTYAGKERVYMLPPDRPNDRSIVIYTIKNKNVKNN